MNVLEDFRSYLVMLRATPGSAFEAYFLLILRDQIGHWVPNPGQLHTRQIFYLLHYLSSRIGNNGDPSLYPCACINVSIMLTYTALLKGTDIEIKTS